jgi:hypothetical protein
LWWTGDSYNSYSSFRDSFAMHLNYWDSLTGNFTWSNSGDNISVGGECINYYAITTGAEAGDLKVGNSSTWAWTRQRRNALAGATGLAFHKPPNRRYKDPESTNFLNNHQNQRSMIAMITSSENTGWFSPATAISSTYLCDTSTADIGSSTDIPDYGGPNARTIPVTGTLTKEKVATGAEMACASGWSSSNYALLSGANLNLGNPIHITLAGWIKLTDISDYSYLVSIADFTNTDAKCGIAIAETGSGNDGKAYFYSAGHTSVYSDITLNDGHWHHVVGVLDSGGNKKSIYVDGIQYGTTSPSNKNYGDVDYISIGSYAGGSAGSLNYHCRGALAMIKLMGSSLTDEQVRHMYRDERALFYDDAACTLYGSSNATTGLAYDEGTGLYHVGTSAGRSDFRGLQRINNTTTAVVSSISASNGLIAEY